MERIRYTKTIGGRQIISYCKYLYIDGHGVSNPTQEQIFADGWEVYVPPVIPPQPQNEPSVNDAIQAVKKMFASEIEDMTDEEALEIAALYPTWASKLPKPGEQVGSEVTVGERLWDDGKLWKVLITHNVQANWRPADSPSLYVEVSIEEIPDWVQPTGANPYMLGDKVKHNGSVWESLVDNNVWEPGAVGTENLWQQLQS